MSASVCYYCYVFEKLVSSAFGCTFETKRGKKIHLRIEGIFNLNIYETKLKVIMLKTTKSPNILIKDKSFIFRIENVFELIFISSIFI